MDLAISILLVVVGVVTGSVGSVVVHKIKQNHAENKAEQIIEKAKKEAEKAKRQSLFEAKEEAHKLKLDVDKEIFFHSATYLSDIVSFVFLPLSKTVVERTLPLRL